MSELCLLLFAALKLTGGLQLGTCIQVTWVKPDGARVINGGNVEHVHNT